MTHAWRQLGARSARHSIAITPAEVVHARERCAPAARKPAAASPPPPADWLAPRAARDPQRPAAQGQTSPAPVADTRRSRARELQVRGLTSPPATRSHHHGSRPAMPALMAHEHRGPSTDGRTAGKAVREPRRSAGRTHGQRASAREGPAAIQPEPPPPQRARSAPSRAATQTGPQKIESEFSTPTSWHATTICQALADASRTLTRFL